ncbi:MAG: agmatinase [Curvibacter sp. RIFCSPHIGHO2_12_FULL_63_18]|uniref:agmatinase n=1 Tax=Rhodoferax sp. TaxID=50421 RepID=UPI0008C66511|nr:agmatinase [Rhodoferax sp.]OGO94500.1 MAG: agmatinase [Curvibacter sp. GWA2_63_95]OGP01220.1 MAG: agmatinase [Curvibacter sp. RIFCSPHIGHO2_12_FULL_63_18]HCX83203.1 agmatinase [Rhodoferax sp.]
MAIGEFAYANNSNRFLASAALQAQPFALVGVPFDGAVTNRPGARFGPQEIRRASLMLCDGLHPVFGVSPLEALGDAGDLRLPNAGALAQVREAIQAQAAALMARHHCVFLGGDHSITLPLLRALHAQHGPVALIHFDAHCDTWEDHFGEPSGHGTWTYEALQEGLVLPQKTVQIGLRSSGTRAAREYVQDQGGLIFTARALRGRDGAGLQDVVQQIRTRIGQQPCYLTLDIDCLDPAFAPGTGTPEPGGMSSSQVLTLLEELADLHFVGMDCVEVAPAYDHAELTSNAAATFVWTYLASQVAKRTA